MIEKALVSELVPVSSSSYPSHLIDRSVLLLPSSYLKPIGIIIMSSMSLPFKDSSVFGNKISGIEIALFYEDYVIVNPLQSSK